MQQQQVHSKHRLRRLDGAGIRPRHDHLLHVQLTDRQQHVARVRPGHPLRDARDRGTYSRVGGRAEAPQQHPRLQRGPLYYFRRFRRPSHRQGHPMELRGHLDGLHPRDRNHLRPQEFSVHDGRREARHRREPKIRRPLAQRLPPRHGVAGDRCGLEDLGPHGRFGGTAPDLGRYERH